MSLIKNKKDIQNLKESGRRLAVILYAVADKVLPGATSALLEETALSLIRKGGDLPAFLNYTPEGAERPYPAALCFSVNNEVVHGIPNENERVLKEGDIVGLDLGIIHKGIITDMAVTVGVGKIDETSLKLMNLTKKSLDKAISVCMPGAHIGDIGAVIEETIEGSGFSVVEELGGHGVGYAVHDEPFIANYGRRGNGPILREGDVLALEPIINEGGKDVVLEDDGYTFKTADGKRSAHFEHTILITKNGAELITKV